METRYLKIIKKWQKQTLASAKKISHERYLDLATKFDRYLSGEELSLTGCHCKKAQFQELLERIKYYLPDKPDALRDVELLMTELDKITWRSC